MARKGIRPLSTAIARAFSSGSSTTSQPPTPKKRTNTRITPAQPAARRTRKRMERLRGIEAGFSVFAIEDPAHAIAGRRSGQSAAPFAFLDKDKIGCYHPSFMMRSVSVVLAIFAIVSITYVLVTPDPADDANGILRPNHLFKAQRSMGVSLLQPQNLVVVVLQLFALAISTLRLTATGLLELVCVCRC